MGVVSSPPLEPYVAVLHELAELLASTRRLETRVLQMLNKLGISDETIGTELDLTSQAVGKRRRRQF